MKKLLLILVLIQTLVNPIKATDSLVKNKTLTEDLDRHFYLDRQLDVYRFNPANLNLWKNGDFSSLSFTGKYEKGDFKKVDEFDKNEQFSIKTESVQTLEESGWRFYGNFTLNVSRHDNALWNLGFHKSEIGSPFRLLIQRNGDFNVKHYGLNGLVNKRINDRLSLAFGIKYQGDLYFRISDTRNDFYTLTTEFQSGLNYKLGQDNFLTVGISYFYRKGEPKFSNEFKTNGPEYYLYFNEGLGDFNDISISSTYYWKNQNPKFYLGYFTGTKNKFSVSCSGFMGNEKWENKITSTLVDNKKDLYKYEYFENKLLISYLLNKESFKLFNLVESQYINGTGYKNVGYFQKTYTYDGLDFKSTSELLRPQAKLFYNSSIDFCFESKSKKDMVYAQQIDYTNLSANIKTGYRKQFNAINAISFDVETLYKYNLSYTHNVVSASSKPYTTNLAYNEIAYHASDYYMVGGNVTWFKKIKNMGIELKLAYKYVKPLNIPVTNIYSVLTKDTKREYLEANLNIYF